MATATLPVGTYVRIIKPGNDAPAPYYARVVGYDLWHSKYEVGRRYPGWGEWRFQDGGTWVFPAWTQEVTEAEATELPAEVS